jgi:hypothetical protein
MKTNNFLKTLLVTSGFFWAGLAVAQTNAVLIYDDTKPVIKFAAGDLKAALEQKRQFTVSTAPPAQAALQTAPVQVIVTTNGAIAGQPAVAGLSKEGYAIRRVTTANNATQWWVIGHDAPGAMYAALEVADTVKIDGGLNNVVNKQLASPSLDVRGFKFNIPLDDRSETYTDKTPSAQYNYVHMWELDYWKRFLDQMARSRMNSLSLWNKHPFPHLVKVDAFPKAALADVYGKQGFLGGGSDDGNKVLLKKLTIEQKIQHWKDVMQYAQDRGVAVSFFTWNVKVNGTEESGYGFKDGDHRPQNTKDYMRASVRALINTYPLLAGVGATAGESFDFTDDNAVKEQWMWDTYGLGYQDAVADMQNPSSPYFMPGRKLKFFHRAHEVNVSSIVNQFNKLPGYADADSSLNFTYKYSQAHMHSSTKPLFIQNWITTVPAGKKVTMEVRNDDFFNLRWGDPDFARAYLNNFPEKTNGFLMGPDGYIWGREVVSKEPDSPRQQYIDKAWYAFMLWGYLAYDRTVDNSRFQALLGARFPEVPSDALYKGLASASKVWPLVTRFFWGNLDFKWYPEASYRQDGGYLGVQAFIDPVYPPMQDDEDGDRPLMMSVKDYVDNKGAAGRMTPVELAAQLKQNADTAISFVQSLNAGADKELKYTIGDVKAMAWLGRYYADKILGAVELYRWQKNKSDTAALNAARTHLQNSANHWRQYAAQWSSQYIKQYVARVSALIDMTALQAKVDADIPGGPVVTPGDTTPPTAPGTLTAQASTSASIALAWQAASDNVGVTGYRVHRNGNLVGTTGATARSYTDTGLAASTTYNYAAYAIDAAGNVSPASNTASATTLAASTGSNFDVTSMVLVNASNGAVIRTLAANDTLSLGNLGAPSVSIQALTSSGAKSVKFESAAAGVSRTEGNAPWAFLGNSGSAYTPWKPAVKTYSITATGHSASGASGTAGKPMTITINVVP